MTIISSEILQISITTKGAEIISVKNNSGLEFIWQAHPDVWPRHAPILFPIVGRLKNDSYTFKNAEYQLSQHGFARDLDFTLVAHSPSACVFELKSNSETKIKFPFDFIFRIYYQVKNNTLEVKYELVNPSSQNIYFSVGAHPGFRCPLLPEEKMEDYYLEFEKEELKQTLLEGGLRSQQTKTLSVPNKKLALSSAVFDQDALVFENTQIASIALRSSKSNHCIEMACKYWPFFGIWSKKGCADFVCLEPWYGIADDNSGKTELSKKKGIIEVLPLANFNCTYTLRFV